MLEWIIHPPLGVIVGIIAGLLGIGGGAVIVPILVFVFTAQGFSAHHIMQMALATSLGRIVFTSVSSFMTHHRHGAVRWDIVRGITLGILIGTFSGTWFAAQLSTKSLKILFACFLYYIAAESEEVLCGVVSGGIIPTSFRRGRAQLELGLIIPVLCRILKVILQGDDSQHRSIFLKTICTKLI